MRALAAGGKQNLVVDVMLRTLGLDICADTLVRGRSPARLARPPGWLPCVAAQLPAHIWEPAILSNLTHHMHAPTLSPSQVGNHMIRGISGGQKKRVTGGEMLVGPAKVSSPAL